MRTALQEAPVEERPYLRLVRRDPCAFCGATGEVLDHIEPKRLGGISDWTNYTAACFSCNNRKGRATLLGFMAWRRYGREQKVFEDLRVLLASVRGIGGLA